MKSETIRVRIDAGVKEQVEAILGKLGLTQSGVVNLLYSHILLHKGLPFEVKIPNAETQAAIDDAASDRNMTSFATQTELFAELDGAELDGQTCAQAESTAASRKTTNGPKGGAGTSTSSSR